MNTLVGVYASHSQAVDAVKKLEKSGFNTSKISLLAKADIVDNHIHVVESQAPEETELSLGAAGGALLGLLSGIGVFAIPGLGFLYGAGAIVGAFAGVDIGIIGGSVAAVLTRLGVDKIVADKYEKHLNEGKYLVFAQGDESEVAKAKEVLLTQNLHLELDNN